MRAGAHRGLSSLYPENSKLAIEKSLEISGLWGTEFDIEITKDRQPVLIHQETFLPNENGKEVSPVPADSKSNWVSKLTSQEIQNLDCGGWFAEEFRGIKVAHLNEILSLSWGDKHPLIELKDNLYWNSRKPLPYHTDLVESVKDSVLNFYNSGGRPYILSFSPFVLFNCRRLMPEIPRVITSATFGKFRSHLKNAALEVKAYCISETVFLHHPESVNMAHQSGSELIVYEHTDYTRQSSRDKVIAGRYAVWEKMSLLNVDAVITNYAEAFDGFLNSRQRAG